MQNITNIATFATIQMLLRHYIRFLWVKEIFYEERLWI